MKTSLATFLLFIFCLNHHLSAQKNDPETDNINDPKTKKIKDIKPKNINDLKQNNISIGLNLAGFTLGYAKKISPMLQPGVEVGVGLTLAYAFIQDPDDGQGYFLFYNGRLSNRFEPKKYFYVDAGIGWGYEFHPAKKDDDSFGGRDVAFAYVQPMIGGKHLKVGMPVYAGSNGNFNLFVTSPVVQYRFWF